MARLTPEFRTQLAERLPGCSDILVVGPVELPAGDDSLSGPVSFDEVMELGFEERYDLSLVFDPSPQDAPAISRLRDLGCQRVLILGQNMGWTTNALRALGFLPVEPLDDLPAFLYDSDLLNQPREWNNARNWANPENFDKYRW